MSAAGRVATVVRDSGASSSPLRSLIADALRCRGLLLLAGLLMVARSAATLTVPWLAGELTLVLLGGSGGNFASATPILLLMLAAFAVQALLAATHGYLLARAGEHTVAALRTRTFDHLQSLPLAYHQDRRRGDVLSLLTRDVDTLSDYVTGTLVAIVPMLLMVCGAWILMLRIDWPLACVAGLLVPLFVVLVSLVGRHIRPLAGEVAEAHGAAVATAEESLGMLPVVKAFSRERAVSDRFRAESHRVRALSNRVHLLQSTLYPATSFLAGAGIVALIGMGSATLAPAELVAFLMYGLLMARPLGSLAAAWGETQHARAAMERLDAVFRVRPEPADAGSRPLPEGPGAISFEGVGFAYEDRESVLEGANLHIAAGETVAITGANGAGKSTLVHLLLRFFEPDTGSIRIDGHDISRVTLSSLRARIGLVPQSILLFNGSVRDNIAFGAADPEPSAVRAAAEAARAHAFIEALPDGYETRIGEGGVKLSGGQQQRIALARALFKDPPVLVLDEATSMFDPEGEEALLALGEETFRARTVILITHRAASLAAADRVVRLEGGRIEPVGSARALDGPRRLVAGS